MTEKMKLIPFTHDNIKQVIEPLKKHFDKVQWEFFDKEHQIGIVATKGDHNYCKRFYNSTEFNPENVLNGFLEKMYD